MNGFKADYQRLFQLFQSRSRVTDTQNSTEVSVKSQPCTSAHEDESITRYEFTFGQFMKCFEQNNFGCIFFGHRSKNELRQFSDEVFEYILDNMSVYLPIELRIFSFYLLYALWSIQQRVFSFQLNIRIDSEAHSNIKHLIENCLSRNQFDILVIYRKLFLTGAFLFCQSIELKGPYYRHYLMKPEKSNVQDNQNFTSELNQDVSSYTASLSAINEHCDQINYEDFSKLIQQFEKNISNLK